MKLYREFKSINHEFPKDRILIAENDDLGKLKVEAEKIAIAEIGNEEIMWNDSLSETTSVIQILKIDDKSELVIRR